MIEEVKIYEGNVAAAGRYFQAFEEGRLREEVWTRRIEECRPS